jgi:arsenate reductase (thioredoxin)
MTQKILFLCPHNAAKSVIAAAYFNRLAAAKHLPWTADSAGTEPSEAVSPVVVAMLAGEQLDVSQHQPRRFTEVELQSASRVISSGCTAEELGLPPERVELWNDVPMVSQQPEAARDAIRAHVEALVKTLNGG